LNPDVADATQIHLRYHGAAGGGTGTYGPRQWQGRATEWRALGKRSVEVIVSKLPKVEISPSV